MNDAKHTKGPSCGCCLEPVDDIRDACDLCSEATGMNDGVGWRIRRCKLHEAAPDLLAVCEDILTFLQRSGYDTTLVRAAIRKAKEGKPSRRKSRPYPYNEDDISRGNL